MIADRLRVQNFLILLVLIRRARICVDCSCVRVVSWLCLEDKSTRSEPRNHTNQNHEKTRRPILCIDLIPTHAQGIRDAIDVVEPGRDQSDLQNGLVIKTSRPQALVIPLTDARRVASQLRYVVKHELVPF